LDALQTEVLKEQRLKGKKEQDIAPAESGISGQNALQALLDAWLIAMEKNKGTASPEWEAMERALGSEPQKKDIVALLQNLEDSPEEEGERLELANLAGDLDDEMRATDRYLETFPKAPPDERLWEAVQKLMDERLSPDLRSKIEGFGLDAASLRDMIVGFIAGIAEGIPAFAALGGKLRFRVALEQVRRGDSAEDKKRVESLLADSVAGKPEDLKQLEKDWGALYKQWLLRKRNAKKAGTPFDEPAPTIHDVWHPPVQPKAPETQPAPLFGLPGFVRGKEFTLSGLQAISDGSTKITVDMTRDKKTVQLEGGKPYALQLNLKNITSATLLLTTDTSKKFDDVEVTLNGGSKLPMRELIAALRQEQPRIASIPGLTFEA